MKNYFNKKQLKQLEPYESHFHTVIYAKYKRATPTRVNNLVADIYEETTGNIVDRNWSCSKCVYSVFEKCGKIYYESIKILNEKDVKNNEHRSSKRNRKSTRN